MSYKKFFAFIIALTTISIVFLQSARAADALEVSVSSDHLMQADTILVVVKNEPGNVGGNLGNVKLHFFRNEDGKDWVAIVGITIDKKPGTYTLMVTAPGKSPFTKEITVSKRNFHGAPLVVTPELSKRGYSAKKIVTTIVNKENKQLAKFLNVVTPIAYFSRPFANPLSQITIVGAFGDFRESKPYKIQHLGVDLKAPIDTPVYAANDGRVVFKKSLPDYGNTLVIDHGLGIYSLYLHLSDFKVATEQMVKQGETIGLSGNTGYTLGPHLHFSVKVRRAALDPLQFIQATQSQW